ncbi:MAG: TetR/AcrR family transcriptional regulator [Myxococcales bacterium]|jgi:AcrR family transcriptional regulator|nr:TetR/AcrR family transcriptional regulator [Myxococcales bacterium]
MARDPLRRPPKPAPNRRDSAQIVEALVRAAMEIDGPDPSINAIAARAGVGVASAYRYFPTKHAIYAEIARRLRQDFLRRLREALDTPGLSLDESVERVCRVAIELPGAGADLRRKVNLSLPVSWSVEGDPTFAEAIDAVTVALGRRLEVPPPDLRQRVFVAFAAGRGVVMLSRAMPELTPDEETLVRHLTRGVRAILLGADPPSPRAGDERGEAVRPDER